MPLKPISFELNRVFPHMTIKAHAHLPDARGEGFVIPETKLTVEPQDGAYGKLTCKSLLGVLIVAISLWDGNEYLGWVPPVSNRPYLLLGKGETWILGTLTCTVE